MNRGWRWLAVAATCSMVVRPLPAKAQSPGGETAATALFDEAHKLMGQRRYVEACPKFAESERLAPSGGTLINLAECYEHTDRTASAWVAWRDAAARADAAGKADAEKRALARAAALEPTLSKLTIAIGPTSDVPGLAITRDGIDVGRAEFGVAIPVDPGHHVVEAKAPEKKPWSSSIDVAARQTEARVTVTLEDEPKPVALVETPPPAPVAAPVEAAPPPASNTTQRTAGIVVTAAGVAGLALGSFFGLEAMAKNNDALLPRNCPTSTKCYDAGLSLTSDARTFATVSTIAFSVGGAAVLGGAILWLTAPPSSAAPPGSASLRIVPDAAPSYAGALLRGRW